MLPLPKVAEPLLMSFSMAFTEPTFKRILVLLVGAVLAKGRRTVTLILWIMGKLAPGHMSDYHRVFSRAPWSLFPLGRILAAAVMEWVPDGPVVVSMDDTTAQHKGKKVYAKGCHHDAVRSSQSHVVHRWGHKWVVLAVVVQLPFASRPWALPVLCALYRPRELNDEEGRGHKTPIMLARGLMCVLMRWFPDKHFIFLGDGGYASHELACFCRRHRKRATLVSRFHGDAALYDPPPKYRGDGRPRVKGRKRKSPQDVVAAGRLRKATVAWYGATSRAVKLKSNEAYWYKAGQRLVPIRWVFVRDDTGTRRDEYYYTTDPTLAAVRIVSLFTQRWPIETTFQEVREHLGFETTRQHVANSVLRTAPCLLGLFTIVSLIFAKHSQRSTVHLCHRPGYEKTEPTFSDAISTVRRLFWSETVFQQPYFNKTFNKLPPKLRNTILDYLSQAV
jgi:hypothetical protein